MLDRVSDDLRTLIEAAAPGGGGYGSDDDDDAPMGDADAVEAATRALVAECDALVAAGAGAPLLLPRWLTESPSES